MSIHSVDIGKMITTRIITGFFGSREFKNNGEKHRQMSFQLPDDSLHHHIIKFMIIIASYLLSTSIHRRYNAQISETPGAGYSLTSQLLADERSERDRRVFSTMDWESLLQALLLGDNAVRSAAEASYMESKTKNPAEVTSNASSPYI